ncbi:MAG TPA: hypothetical protein VJH03_02025 [Blastocatellia bacterium]|nr:hypothetical protein [Blastocatellia bacterium]
MAAPTLAAWMLEQEARGLLTRLARVEPFALHMPMVSAAAITPAAQVAIERHMASRRRELRGRVADYLRWLKSPIGQQAPPQEAQRRFTFLKLRFNAVLSQFHIFADVLTQRSEHETGVWLSGLDAVAADALALPRCYFAAPPVICYLDRGPGAAIRRVRTPLPGGSLNPVAIVRVPRERMIGSGLASSLVHEVGHQGSALLGLLASVRREIERRQVAGTEEAAAWRLYARWISEILADFWSIARLGVTATLGLMGVVSLPRTFVFRLSEEDPHPIPWIRVKLGVAMGRALHPSRRWDRIAQLWESYYPLDPIEPSKRKLFAALEGTMPALAALLVNHRPGSLGGKSLKEAMAVDERQPARLADYWAAWRASPSKLFEAAPSLVFAVVGQAKGDGKISPEEESNTLTRMLTHWALKGALETSTACASRPPAGLCRPGWGSEAGYRSIVH